MIIEIEISVILVEKSLDYLNGFDGLMLVQLQPSHFLHKIHFKNALSLGEVILDFYLQIFITM